MANIIYPPTQDFLQTKLTVALSAANTTSATLNAVTGIQNNYGVMIVDRVDSNGVATPSKVEVIKFAGTSGSTVTTLTRGLAGTSAQDHAVEAVVEFAPDIVTIQALVDVIKTAHDDTGKINAAATYDSNGNEELEFTTTASAVNNLKITNAATGNAPQLSASGDDTNVDLKLSGKGAGKVQADASFGAITAATDASTVTFNCATSNRHRLVLGGNRTLALSNAKTGQNIILDLLQDSTGSRTVTWPVATNTATMTIATPCVVTAGLDLPTLTPVYFTTSGALPTGITANTVYYYIRQSSTTGNLATSVANAQAGTYVATSGSQSGTHTISVKIRWTNQTEPTLSTGKYLVDTFGLYIVDSTNGVIQGYTGGQGL